MRRDAAARLVAALSATAIVSAGCMTVRELVGVPIQSDPSVTLRSSEPKWLLIKNPRFGDIASEPEYIWVEEDKIPFTMKGLVLREEEPHRAAGVVAKYGAPPGGGRDQSRQGGPYQIESAVPTVPTSRGPVAAVPAPTRTDAASTPKLNRGFVVYVDTTRFVIDLSASDGVRAGSTVSVRRDKIAIVHPITGELLGELDEEVATGKVTEVRDKFSVVEIENVSSGAQVKVKDRVVVR